MAGFENIELETKDDYEFFAAVLGEKLRNPNFKGQWLEVFLKTFLEQIKPLCSLRAYEKIQKNFNELAIFRHQQEKEQKQRQKKQSNKKQKNLKTAKVMGRTDKFGVEIEEDPYSDEDSDYYSDEGR